MRVIIVGPDQGLEEAFRAVGVETTRIAGIGTAAALAEAGVEHASCVVVTDVNEATVIPIAREANPGIRAVIYSESTMPEFVRPQVDFAVTPRVFEPSVLAEELARRHD